MNDSCPPHYEPHTPAKITLRKVLTHPSGPFASKVEPESGFPRRHGDRKQSYLLPRLIKVLSLSRRVYTDGFISLITSNREVTFKMKD